MLTATKSSRINISEEGKTRSIAKIFSNYIKVGNILCFKGELGVGKTTFIKYLINFLQTKNNQPTTEVLSPTFNLVNEYHLESLIIKHYDLYRIYDEKELNSLGIFEDICKHITLIEWPEIIKKYEIINKFELYFEYEENFKKRFVTVSSTKNINFLNELL